MPKQPGQVLGFPRGGPAIVPPPLNDDEYEEMLHRWQDAGRALPPRELGYWLRLLEAAIREDPY